MSAPPEWVLGILLGIAGCLGIAFGMLLLKYTHLSIQHASNLHADDPDNYEMPRPFYCQILWWLGFILIMLASGPLDMAALSMIPQSVFAPLSGLTLCFNAVISPWLLGEKLAQGDAIATVLVVAGAGLTTMFGDHKKQSFTADELTELVGALATT